MILPTTTVAVWILAIVSLLCLGSWANTLKLAGKWRFEYYYYDFVLGILVCAGVAALVLGSGRPQELTFQDNLLLTGYRKMAWVLGSGVVLNLGMLLLLATMTIAGMSVAFPLTLGVALVIGAVWDFFIASQANVPLTFIGIALLLGAVIVTVLTYTRLLRVRRDAAQKALTPDPRIKSKRAKPAAGATLAIVLSVVGGIALSTFPRILAEGTSGENGLAPYSAVLFLSVAALLSSPFFVLFFTTFPVATIAGSPHWVLSRERQATPAGLGGRNLVGGRYSDRSPDGSRPAECAARRLDPIHPQQWRTAGGGRLGPARLAGVSRGRRARAHAGGRDAGSVSGGAGYGGLRIFPKMMLHGRCLACVSSYEMKCALGLLALMVAAGPAFGGEYVVFSSGLKMHADRHEQSGSVIRLFYNGGVTEVPATLVSGFEEEEVVTPPPARRSPRWWSHVAPPIPRPGDSAGPSHHGARCRATIRASSGIRGERRSSGVGIPA